MPEPTEPKVDERDIGGQMGKLQETIEEAVFQLTAVGFRLDKLEDLGEMQVVEELRPLLKSANDSLDKLKIALEKYPK
ncbi:MAG: hypothetical protein AAB374_02905 [Patescibacteria group bacterium]